MTQALLQTLPPGDTAVAVTGLTRTFGDFRAVDNIDLAVAKGEIFGFLGPNGAGKSTTIRMLCGLLLPSAGAGAVGGFDIMRESEEIKKHIGYMSQRFSLYDDLTIEENIDFFSGIYGVPDERKKERKEWVLEMAGIGGKRKAITRTMASGFKQRLALGCAVIHEPSIIFLDEPTSGVDPISRRRFWDLIYEMSSRGTTVFVTTHYLDEAEYCDRLALIYRGRIIAGGRPDVMKKEHMHKQILEVSVADIVEALDVLGRGGFDVALFGSVIHATVDDSETATAAIRSSLSGASIAVSNITTVRPSLEDVFVSLIEAS
ncbi:MAG: ABC transporter ATP-binding protein [Syntrophorhabdaceae bacterium]|nr:ABC transporter ATP-binding protein [Syntrophorhabdaceae bacterium]